MKKLIAFIAVIMLTVGATYARDKYYHNADPLPAAAKSMLSKYFSGLKVSQVKEDAGLLGVEDYEVILNNGTKIEFNKDGSWKEVNGGINAIPKALLLKSINTFISKNYAGNKIVKIQKERNKYEVELNNGMELDFDRAGNFLRIEY